MLAFAKVLNDQKVSWLEFWNQYDVLKEVAKFPKQKFWNGTFDRWLHNAIFWFQVNVFPFETLYLM
jgi:hypothetical protein